MSDHSFNPFIAKKYGVIEAILVNTLVFWTRTNIAKEKEDERNFHQERYWCFGTPVYFTKFFMYLTSSQIKYALLNLRKKGALLKGNFNKKGYDKTNWYSLSDQLLLELNLNKECQHPATALIGQFCPMEEHNKLENDSKTSETRASTHRTNLDDASDKFSQPIPDTKPVTKQKKKTTNCKSSSSSFIFSETIDRDMLNQKLERDTRTDEDFMQAVSSHVQDHSDKKYPPLQRAAAAVKLLKKCKEANVIFYVSGTQPKDPTPENKKPKTIKWFTDEEDAKLNDYKHWQKTMSKHTTLESWYPNEEKRAEILALVEREEELINNANKGAMPENHLQSRH